MMFSPPYFVECPSCKTKHEHCDLWSFNDFDSERFSDGFISFFGVERIQKCSYCNHIIETNNLTKLGEVEFITSYYPQNFWQKLFKLKPKFKDRVKVEEAPMLEYLSLPDWVVGSKSSHLSDFAISRCKEIAMWKFNQLSYLEKKLLTEEGVKVITEVSNDIVDIENGYLHNAETDFTDSVQLLAADIYRRRSEFNKAKECINRITSNDYAKEVHFMNIWIDSGSSKLEKYPAIYEWNR